MQYSIVNKSRLHGNLRIDAEFYSPDFLQLEKTLNSHQTKIFSMYSLFIKKGIFDLSPDFYRDQGIPLIRTSEIKDPQIDFSSTVFLDEKTQALNRKTELMPGDIVFTKIGAYIGDVAMLPKKYDRYNFSQNVTGVKLKKDMIMPGFLLAYLLSKYGKGQIKRIIMLSGQGKLELEDIKNIKVVLLDEKIKALTHKIVLQVELLREKSVNIYREAEQILLSELGLLNWKPKHQLSFVKNFSNTQSADRIDAEYFQPMYEEILSSVSDNTKRVISL
ncbi:restriction endonuclease subunit S [bacterium]|nr:restriction endonuclease subunit S [bacterium]